jgi:tetratricopeptide (TPR) repeat protein
VAVLFFAGTLVPALGFINVFPMRYSFVADHFQYHASIGLIALAAAGLRRFFAPMWAVILLILAVLTWQQGFLYKNQLVLWSDVVKRNPNSWMAWGDLGDQYAALSNRTDLPQSQRDADRATARQCYQKLYTLAPNQPQAHFEWGIVHEFDGDTAGAKAEFEKALEIEPKFTLAMNSLGMLLIRENQPDAAMEYFKRAIALDPGYAEARVNYGDALLARHDTAGALAQYQAAVDHRPDNVQAQFTLANVLLTNEHRPDLAIPHYIAAIYSDPNRADIRTNFAGALLAIGQIEEARNQCRVAVTLDPNLPQARQLWARLWAN